MGGVPSGPGTLLVCQSAMPKHLKGKKNKKVSLGLGPMVYLVLFHFEFCQILRGGSKIDICMQVPRNAKILLIVTRMIALLLEGVVLWFPDVPLGMVKRGLLWARVKV